MAGRTFGYESGNSMKKWIDDLRRSGASKCREYVATHPYYWGRSVESRREILYEVLKKQARRNKIGNEFYFFWRIFHVEPAKPRPKPRPRRAEIYDVDFCDYCEKAGVECDRSGCDPLAPRKKRRRR